MRIENEVKLSYKDVLIKPKRSTIKSRKDVDLNREFTFVNSGNKWSGIPIVASNMLNVGTIPMYFSLNKFNMLSVLHKYHTLKDLKKNLNPEMDLKNLSISTGITDEDFIRTRSILEDDVFKKIPFLLIDAANGYTEIFIDFVKKMRDYFPYTNIIAGAVVSGEITEELILSGADIIKVGIGGGSVCTTRIKTAIGFPQLSAIIETSDSAHGLGGLVMADGNCTVPGDVVKSFGAGADFSMLGGMFAGTDENENTTMHYDKEGKVTHMEFYGMSSEEAMIRTVGEVSDYKAAEGKKVKILYKGPVENIIKDILGGVRSACAYIGARKLKELSKRTTFIRVTEQENRVFS